MQARLKAGTKMGVEAELPAVPECSRLECLPEPAIDSSTRHRLQEVRMLGIIAQGHPDTKTSSPQPEVGTNPQEPDSSRVAPNPECSHRLGARFCNYPEVDLGYLSDFVLR